MTVDEAVQYLDGLDAQRPQDPEVWHSMADNVLLAMVPPGVADAYDRLVSRSPWWATA